MSSGIGASITNLSNGTVANAPDVLSSLNALNAAGVSNDGGLITTSGAGIMTLAGLIANGAIAPNAPSTTINGGNTGTATLWQFFVGTYKYTIIALGNFRTGGAAQTIALPTPYLTGAIIRTGLTGTSATNAGIGLMHSGALQSINIYATLSANGATQTSQNFIYTGSFGDIQVNFDTVQFQASGTAGHTAIAIIEGV